ncbi:transketolase [Paramagnetospirillum kuznetsovii]|uniref:Transketolase n=2 Tax=Paramagnetospirillum kuznetsovii TaxID=2053833 RepID=A0A364P3T0_9PROT|nr:transketolase [Paramagnetospirillum kuznetsovii]
MVHKAAASHIGACLSMADILAVLYGRVLRIDPQRPHWPDRDRYLLSKGHAAAIVYSALAERGFFPSEWLEQYCQDDGPLPGHISHVGVPGVEVSTGSLGHALPIAVGMALAAKQDGADWKVYVQMSDGECDEGSVWEAILFAAQAGLDNLVVVVDYNKIQSLDRVANVSELEPFADKWRAFRWSVVEVDGHDHDALTQALTSPPARQGRPSVIIAHTVKGKGVSFMEDTVAWHYRSPDADQLAKAVAELSA